MSLERLAAQLNEQVAAFLGQPLVAVTVPWLLRRALRRPYRRR